MTEVEIITAIIDRAELIAARYSVDFSRLNSTIDIELVHQLCPLDLAALLAADQAEFVHDFFGIRKHFDRSTRTLTECFVPRFALNQ